MCYICCRCFYTVIRLDDDVIISHGHLEEHTNCEFILWHFLPHSNTCNVIVLYILIYIFLSVAYHITIVVTVSVLHLDDDVVISHGHLEELTNCEFILQNFLLVKFHSHTEKHVIS